MKKALDLLLLVGVIASPAIARADDAKCVAAFEETQSLRSTGKLSAARERLSRLERSPMSSDVSIPLRAPMPGVLARIYASSGQSVSQGERLADVVDLSRMWVRAEIYVGTLDRIDPHAEAQVRALGETEPHRATRLEAPPVARPSGSVLEIDYSLENAEGLVPHSRVEVEIPLAGSEQEALSVPWSAACRP